MNRRYSSVGKGGAGRAPTRRAIAAACATLLAVAACGGTADEGESGVLQASVSAEAPTLDWHRGPAGATQQVAVNIFETLYAVDENYRPVPMLAADYPDVSDDGLVHTIELREGVTFHNGETMTAADVVASLRRWGAVSVIGQGLFDQVEEIVALDDRTVEITLESPNNDLVRVLAVPVSAAAIMPRSVLDEVGEDLIEDDDKIVGTGPFMLKEWARGSYYELERFDDYAVDDRPHGGLAGDKQPSLAGVRITFNPDAGSRLAGIETGQFDLAVELPGDYYDRVADSDAFNVTTVSPFYSAFVLLNTSRPPFDDPAMRQAAHYAIDAERTMEIMMGHESMYELSGGIYPEGMDILHTDAAAEDYLTHDPQRASQLLDDAGYDGEEIVYMTSQAIPIIYDAAVAIAQDMNEAGFNVRLDVSEWADVVSRLDQPDTWDMFGTAFGVGYIAPSGHQLLSGYSPFEGWYALGDAAQEILDNDWQAAETDAEREAVMAKLQAQFYEDRPAIKLGDYNRLSVSTPDVVTESPDFYWPTYWTIRKS